jgi:cytochrome o ubiquinol oxidase subunit 2
MNWNFVLFNPGGPIALEERNVIFTLLVLMSLLAIPFFIVLIRIVRRYRADNNWDYEPEYSGSTLKQILLWILPAVLVAVMCVIIWRSTHSVDPFKQLESTKAPITVEVVALEWKWLFIYPEQHIATVNLLEFPENTPVNFVLTADAPMNSFWIPGLGGQMYAMSGMTTQLHLMADRIGEFRGGAAEISGPGFADMNFIAKSVSDSDFKQWVELVKLGRFNLTTDEYAALSKKSMSNPASYYASVDASLFDSIVNKYMNMSTNEHNH